MKPKRIIIVRHAESQSNADKSARSKVQDHRIALTDLGIQQALAHGFKLEGLLRGQDVGIWVSPFERTRQTFRVAQTQFGNLNVRWVREDPRIREQEWGHLLEDAKTSEKIDAARDAYSRFWYRIPDGESGADVFDRISTWLETLHRDFKKPDHPENLVIYSHGFTARVILMKWLHWTVEQFEQTPRPDNCGVYELRLKQDNRYELVQS